MHFSDLRIMRVTANSMYLTTTRTPAKSYLSGTHMFQPTWRPPVALSNRITLRDPIVRTEVCTWITRNECESVLVGPDCQDCEESGVYEVTNREQSMEETKRVGRELSWIKEKTAAIKWKDALRLFLYLFALSLSLCIFFPFCISFLFAKGSASLLSTLNFFISKAKVRTDLISLSLVLSFMVL